MGAIFPVMNRKASGLCFLSGFDINVHAYNFCLEYDLFIGPNAFSADNHFARSVVSIHKALCRIQTAVDVAATGDIALRGLNVLILMTGIDGLGRVIRSYQRPDFFLPFIIRCGALLFNRFRRRAGPCGLSSSKPGHLRPFIFGP